MLRTSQMKFLLFFIFVATATAVSHRQSPQPSAKVLQPLSGLQERLCTAKVSAYSSCDAAKSENVSFAKGRGETFHSVHGGVKMVDVPKGCKVSIYSKVMDTSSPRIGGQQDSHALVVKGPNEQFCVETLLYES